MVHSEVGELGHAMLIVDRRERPWWILFGGK
jgi:hypothetical protein